MATGTIIAGARFGNGRTFPSAGDAIDVDRTDFKLPEFTVEAWIYIDSMSGSLTHCIVSNLHSGVDQGFFITIDAASQKVLFTVGSGVGSDYHLFSTSTISEKQWYHIAATYDGALMKIYVNGFEDASAAWASLSYESSTTYPLKIGNYNLNPWDTQSAFFCGTIDEIRISNRARQSHELNVPSITGLVALYPFNDSANDESGNGSNGTFVGGVSPAIDRFGQANSAYLFDGSTGYINVPSSNHPLGNVTVTYSCWVKPVVEPSTYWHIILDAGSKEFFKRSALMDQVPVGHAVTYTIDGGQYAQFSYAMVDNEWTHLVFTKDGDTTSLFVNDSLIGTSYFPSSQNLTSSAIRIGGSDSLYDCFHGLIDDIRIYDRVINPAQIDSLYHEGGWNNLQYGPVAYYPFNGNANDESGNGIDGTAIGAVLDSNRFGEPQKAYTFNGVNSSIQVPPSFWFAFDVTRQFAISSWIKISGYSHQALAFKGGAINPPGYFNEWAVVIEPDHTLRLKINANGHHSSYSYLTSSPSVELNKWAHVVALWNGAASIMKLYLNGEEVGSTTAIDQMVSMPDRPLYLGFVGDGPFAGRMDDVRIYNRVLNQVEIDSLYHEGGWNGNEFDPIAYYPFNGNANDESGNGNNGSVSGAVLAADRFGHDSSAYHFDGSSYITTPEPFLANQPSFTISAWATTEELNTIDHAVFFKGHGVVGFGISDSTFGFGVKLSDNQWYKVYDNTPQELNRYYHFLARYQKGNKIDFWVDGELIDSLSVPNRDLIVGDFEFNASIGSVYGGSQYFWRGMIDDMRVYGRAITDAEIRSLYHEGGWALLSTPTIVSITDIENDQGGKVRIKWNNTDYDSAGISPQVTSYGVWRKIPPGVTSKMKPGATIKVANDTLGTLYDFLGSVIAVQSPQYNFVASTLQDSSASGTHAEQFLVSAHTNDPNIYFISEAASGYSVDNLPPIMPSGLAASVQGDSLVQVTWNSPTDPDVSRYEIFRSTTSGFIPVPGDKIGTSFSTEYTDANAPSGIESYYRIIAVDVHDNFSPPSLSIGVAVTISQSISLRDNWNLISVPLTVGDYTKTVLFPSALTKAFAYEGTYVAYGTLSNSIGYWLKFSGAQLLPVTGLMRTTDTVDVNIGWNLIGSISAPIAASKVTSIPAGITTTKFFGYAGVYQISDTIRPGAGYWVKVNQAGKLILSSSISQAASTIQIVSGAHQPPSPPEGVEPSATDLPKDFALEQNYPNPFNPKTKIRYGLPQHSNVHLAVFNTLGQQAALLVDGEQEAGYHDVQFDATELTSGVYFYRLTAGSFVETKKLILLK